MRLRYGPQETMLIELAAEPWLLEPIVDVPVETQLTRMNLDMIKDSVDYAERTRYQKQYLWGGEWWYWLKQEYGRDGIWEWAKTLYTNGQ